MKAAIVLFSPSGNTLRIGKMIETKLLDHGMQVQMVNITGNEAYFSAANQQEFLKKTIQEHDILLVGGPVYAHHLQYHVKDLIMNLPKPTDGWGKIAIPFVTYGGIRSGIALGEAGELLRKSGRKVLAGLKVSAPHYMTKAILGEVYNKDLKEDKIYSTIERLIKRIKQNDLNALKDQSKSLKYQNILTYLQANLIFIEKVCHEKRYPKLLIDEEKCNKCGKCVNVCSVCHLKQNENQKVITNDRQQCIHCFNCVYQCPKNAVYFVGDIEKAKGFMNDMINKPKEQPDTCLYPQA